MQCSHCSPPNAPVIRSLTWIGGSRRSPNLHRLTAVTTNLFQVAPAGQPSHPHGCPPESDHQLGKAPTRTGAAAALRHLQEVEHGLGGQALNAIVTNLTVQPFQPERPHITRGR